MPSPSDASVSEGYFNDLSQQLPPQQDNQSQPKSKRVACILCRKRKLRCDGARPACATCTRLSHDCIYDEVRKKSGPKRGYVKELEARLAQVETMLKTQDGVDIPMPRTTGEELPDFGGIDMDEARLMRDMHCGHSPQQDQDSAMPDLGVPLQANMETSTGGPASMPWEPSPLISLGMDEPLPAPEVVAELTQLYFDRCHNAAPMIHPARFRMQMLHSSPNLRPPLKLLYAMWTLGASASPKYEGLRDHLYRRARHYIERDEMIGVGEKMLSLSTVQTWQCIAAFEFKMMYFPRAWLSTGRASRLAMMMGLHRLDGQSVDVKQCLPPPKDWTEKEERRRTFWMCFAGDRYASIGTGWPMSIDEGDIMTHLPASDEAFESCTYEPSVSLQEALEPGGAEKLDIVGAVGIISCLFGRNLLHLHRKSPEDDDYNIDGLFWKRHRSIDTIILNLSLGLPEKLRLPAGAHNPNIVFMNMCIHTSTICLHQAAIFKVEKHRLPGKMSAESKMRCLTAAAEIASLMKMTSHHDMSKVNPFMSFSVYVAARVFVQYLKSRPKDDTAKASLHFLLSALQAMKKTNPLAESFVAQLDVDLEAAGLDDLRSLRVRAARMSQQEQCPSQYDEATYAAGAPKKIPVYGDGGLARHSGPENRRDPLPRYSIHRHKGDFSGILAVRPNMSAAGTAETSPETQSSTDAELMDFCSGSGSMVNDSTPPNGMQNLSPTGFTPDSSTSTSSLTFRHNNLDWARQQSLSHTSSSGPSPPAAISTQQFQMQTQPQSQTRNQQNPQSQTPAQSQNQAQTQRQHPHPPPPPPLLPEVADFSGFDFADFDKGASATVLELGAVDETQLFNLSDAEWGQVIGDLNTGDFNGAWNQEGIGML